MAAGSSTAVKLVWEDPPDPSPASAALVLALAGIDPAADHGRTRILDFGCGRGRYMEVFARHVPRANITGCDSDGPSVEAVRALGFRADVLDGDGAGLPYGDSTFDVVFSSNVIEHIPRDRYMRYLAEIHRVLRRGGVFVVAAPNYPVKRIYDLAKALRTRGYRRYYLFDDPTHCNRQSVLTVERQLRRHFRDVRLEGSYFFFQRHLRFLRRPSVRHRLRLFADKFTGRCVRP